MIKPKASQRLVSSVDRILRFVEGHRNAPFLLLVVQSSPQLDHRSTLKDTEAEHRRKCLQEFQKLPRFQVTSPDAYNDLLRALYPVKYGLTQLKSSAITKTQVNHSVLFKCYTSLPGPGAGHLHEENFEDFMEQMFHNRVFSRPNLLSSSAFTLYKEQFLLKQYSDAIQYRKDHLAKLWHITKDMDAAKIPLSDYERRQMVYMTFYRDRPDILQKVKVLKSHSAEKGSGMLSDSNLPTFSWNTYQELVNLNISSMNDAKYLNTLLFCALRHANWAAEKDILSRIKPEGFTRDTYKILLDNHAMHRRHDSFEAHLDSLSHNHLHFLDSKLLDIVIRSLSVLGHSDLCSILTSPFLEHGCESLTQKDYFLKQLTYSDKVQYSAHLRVYDAMSEKPPVQIFPTVNTFVPLLEHYCATGASSKDIIALLYIIEDEWGLPLSTLMFKDIFNSFTTSSYETEHLELVTMKLIELLDQYNANDSWIKERLNETFISTSSSKVLLDILNSATVKHHGADEGVFLKLSNGLMRLVFTAYQSVYRASPEKRAKISKIEEILWQRLDKTEKRHPTGFHDELQPSDLYGREELAYLKKASLLELLDI